jgi:hydrogenase expression/formation protein HypD
MNMTRILYDSDKVRSMVQRIKAMTPFPLRIMEVCGTHTHAVSRYSFRQILAGHIEFISGPGCPVCVTSQLDIDRMIAYAKVSGVISTTFGDMMRVPGTSTSLSRIRASGADIRVVFSPLDSLQIAQDNPQKEVIFFGVGFETTAPIVAASIHQAQKLGINNFSVLSLHKTIPQALSTLFNMDHQIDGLLLPGHVSAVLGTAPFCFLPETFNLPSVVTGFTPVEILEAVRLIGEMAAVGSPKLLNAYQRVVPARGNPLARCEITEVFESTDSQWRGLGTIPNSGLKIRLKYAPWNAECKFQPDISETVAASDCRCGEVIMGKIRPHQCPLFATRCTPGNPHGPCMVSGEGACAAYYQHDRHIIQKGDRPNAL